MTTADRIFELVNSVFNEQRAFAIALGLPPSVISAWRTGKSTSFNKRLPQIAKLLGTTVEYLATGINKDPATHRGDGEDPEMLELLRRVPPERMPEVERYLRFLLAEQEAEKGKP